MAEGRREAIPRLGESRVVVGGSRGCRTPALEVTAWLDHSRSVGVHQEQRTDEHQEQRRDVHARGQKASEDGRGRKAGMPWAHPRDREQTCRTAGVPEETHEQRWGYRC